MCVGARVGACVCVWVCLCVGACVGVCGLVTVSERDGGAWQSARVICPSPAARVADTSPINTTCSKRECCTVLLPRGSV